MIDDLDDTKTMAEQGFTAFVHDEPCPECEWTKICSLMDTRRGQVVGGYCPECGKLFYKIEEDSAPALLTRWLRENRPNLVDGDNDIKAAKTTRDEIVATADAAYEKAVNAAKNEYEKDIVPAKIDYDKAIDSAKTGFHEATYPAKAKYDEAIKKAWAARRKAVDEAEMQADKL